MLSKKRQKVYLEIDYNFKKKMTKIRFKLLLKRKIVF